jgi:hypothetical protein
MRPGHATPAVEPGHHAYVGPESGQAVLVPGFHGVDEVDDDRGVAQGAAEAPHREHGLCASWYHRSPFSATPDTRVVVTVRSLRTACS